MTRHFIGALLALGILSVPGCAPDPNPTAPDAPGALSQGERDDDDRGDDDDDDDDGDGDENGGNDDENDRGGAVYSMSNDPNGNTVVRYDRARNGQLSNRREFATGGTGSGGFEDTSNGLVLGNASRESSPIRFTNASDLLFATNAGSNTISVFRVTRRGLRLVEVQNSGGEKPVSVTVSRGIVYVLNNGENVDGLVPPNCSVVTGGQPPSITGFRVSGSGQLTPIPGSTRALSGDGNSGCAQVSFDPRGRVLVVTERTARTAAQAPGDEGVINTFVVRNDGTLGTHRVFDATGQGPFGFTFTRQGGLLTSEQQDGPLGPGRGTAAGYSLNSDGTLTPTSPAVNNGGTDSCWFIVTDNGRYGYVTSFFGDGQISRYRVRPNGGLALEDPRDDDGNADTGASDLALSRNSRFLYQLNSMQGQIKAYRVGRNGDLTFFQSVQAHAPSTMAAPLGMSAS